MHITNEDYFKNKMASTPVVKRGKEHIVKKNECLWTIAQKELGENAKKSEILEYVYKIGKLNNKTSIKDINSLKINEKIYLPQDDIKSNSIISTPQKSLQKVAPRHNIKTNCELGYEDLRDNILNTDIRLLSINEGYKGPNATSYAVYKKKENQPYIKKLICSFTMDKNHKLIDIKFNGRKNEIDIRYDFIVDKNGKITRKNDFMNPKTLANVNKDEILKIETVLKTLVENIEMNNMRKKYV